MKIFFKKAISLLTVISMLTVGLVLPSNATLTTADVTTAMNYYAYNVYQSGRYWDGGNLNVSHSSTQCNYRVCTCNTYQGASQCQGFALYLSYLLTGSAPKGTLSSYKNGLKSGSWTCYTLSVLGFSGLSQVGLQPGDIVRASYDSSYKNGHTAVVWKIENGLVYFAECWGDRHCKLNWGGFNYYSYSLAAICSRYPYVAVWRNGAIVPSDSVTPPIVCQHNYLQGSDASHPHAVFMKCSKCADSYYTNQNTSRADCPCCQGLHTWNYLYESVHPHAEMQSCIGCGVQKYTGNSHYDSTCAVCTGLPYDLSVNPQSDSLMPGQTMIFDATASNATSLYLDVYKNGLLFKSVEIGWIKDVRYTPTEAGIYSVRLRAVNANGKSVSDISLPFTVDSVIKSVTESDGLINVKYADPLSRELAEKFCAARKGVLTEHSANGFTLTIDTKTLHSTDAGDTKYILFPGSFSWTEANTIAKAMGKSLARILSKTDSSAVSDLMKQSGAQAAWLDGSDAENEGIWKWSDGARIDYTNWNLAHSTAINSYANWICTYRSGQWCEEVLWGNTDAFIVEDSSEFKYTEIGDNKIIVDRWSAHVGDGRFHVTVPQTIDGHAVAGLSSEAFTGRPVDRVYLPAYLETVGKGAVDGIAEVICPRYGCTYIKLTEAGVDNYKFTIPFTDVAVGKWYEDAVRYCYGNFYIEGTSATTFEPSAQITRAMFVTILCSMSGADRSQYTDSSFPDVPTDKWYASSVEWAFQNGLTAGYAGNFNPSGKLSRQELATFMLAYAEFMGEDVASIADPSLLDVYEDASQVSSWAVTPMAWAVARGILSGTTAVTLSPKDISTRAQVSQIVMKFTMNN